MMRGWLACWLVVCGSIVPFLGDGFAGPQPPRTTLATHRLVLGDPESWALVRGSQPGRPGARIAGGVRPARDGRPPVPGEWGLPADGYRLPDLRRGECLSATPICGELSATRRNPVCRAPPATSIPLV